MDKVLGHIFLYGDTHTHGQEVYEKRWSTSQLTRKMQTQTTMRYPVTTIRMATIKTKAKVPENNKCWPRSGEIGTLL